MPYQPTSEDIQWMERNLKPISPQQPSVLERAGDIAGRFNELVQRARLPEIAGGFLQGSERGIASLANIPLSAVSRMTGKDIRLPYVDLQKYLPQDPTSRIAFGAGEIGGAAVPGIGAYKAISSARRLPALVSALGKPTLAAEAGAGALAGAGTGAQEKGDVSDRLISALTGGVLPVVSGLRYPSLAKKIIGTKESLKEELGSAYKNIFNELENTNIHNDPLKVPSKLTSEKQIEESRGLYNSLPLKTRKSLDAFKKNPNFENSHWAQSDLGKTVREMEDKFSRSQQTGKPVLSSELNAKNFAKDLQKRIQGNMQQFLLKNNKSDLLDAYAHTSSRYGKEFSPFTESSIAKFQAGKISPKKMIKSLQKSSKFMESGAQREIPGFMTRKRADVVLDPTKKALGYGLAGLGLGTAAYELGIPGMGLLAEKLRDIG